MGKDSCLVDNTTSSNEELKIKTEMLYKCFFISIRCFPRLAYVSFPSILSYDAGVLVKKFYVVAKFFHFLYDISAIEYCVSRCHNIAFAPKRSRRKGRVMIFKIMHQHFLTSSRQSQPPVYKQNCFIETGALTPCFFFICELMKGNYE